MKSFTIVALLVTLALVAADHEIRVWNNCPFTIWPGVQTNANVPSPVNFGFQLNNYNTKSFRVPNYWSGRVWARTQTGPASLAELTLSPANGGMDFYDVSLVDGFNLPVEILPIAGTYSRRSGGHFDCTTAGCHRGQDVNAHCPREMAIYSGGRIVGCKNHNAGLFKHVCPDAYSYPKDDQTSTFTCHGNPKAGYVIKFCP